MGRSDYSSSTDTIEFMKPRPPSRVRQPREAREEREHYYDVDDYSDSDSDLIDVRRLTRAEPYVKPDNAIEVDLQNTANSSTFNAQAPARQTTENRLDRLIQIRQRHHFESIEWRKILSVRRYVNQDARETALVQSQMSTAGGGKDDFQFPWIHLKAQHPQLHDFQNFVATLDSVDPDERSLATVLLKKIAEEHVQSHSWGKFLEGRVDRCDGHTGAAPDKWAIFLSVHHLHAGPRPRGHSVAPDSHPPRTLFEYHYKDQENTAERDAKQIMRRASRSDEILHVHNLWLLLLSSGTLITSSPDPVDDYLGTSVLVEDITNQSAKGELQIIRFFDPTDRQFFVPSAHCETWFAMMDKVVGLCGSTYGEAPERYHVSDINGIEVTAPDWQQFLASQDSFCATVRISLVSLAPPPPPDVSEAFGRDSVANITRHDGRVLVKRYRDDEFPSYRKWRYRPRRDSSGSRYGVEARPDKESREEIEKKNKEIEREVASVLRPGHDPTIDPGADAPENATSPLSRTATGELEYQPMYSHDRTESPIPMDTTAQKSHTQSHTQWSRTPPVPRSGRRTADSLGPVMRRTSSAYVEVRGQQREDNALALVPYTHRGRRSRSREPGAVSRRSTSRVDCRIAPRRPTESTVDVDRDRDQLALVRGDMRTREEREQAIKRRRENSTYRIDFLPHIITNQAPPAT
ncbi:hypothetical protein A1O3_09104 [Capronia epimyces CBS 606.96]|uniref:Uncharacterized protein n=1 Tax=Capronia epimyces CBS 606.96 TaxID=1182542 RepID=W9XKV3_9EURO|nr:uncharacterized protein A1O3_09104 [Capronia epimyces CBS 606.96]EXJ77945.1 hypothetical protein A1O3_09104 [Capronia epimyces CBS 606.96]